MNATANEANLNNDAGANATVDAEAIHIINLNEGGSSEREHTCRPEELAAGIYWYVSPGRGARICEKKDGDPWVGFTNGAHQSWILPGEYFLGPLQKPAY